MTDWAIAHFRLDERETSVATEVRAGVVTFLTMSYILLVNPQILSAAGIPAEDVVVATALGSALGTFVTGYLGNLPFGLAPGMGLSVYLAYGLVHGATPLPWESAVTCCFIAGVLMGIFAATGISAWIMTLIPAPVKLATVVGMGLLIALIGMKSVGLVVPNEDTLVTLGDLSDYNIWLAMLGLMVVGTLTYRQVKGGILIGIIFITLVSWTITGDWPASVISWPTVEFGPSKNIDLAHLGPEMLPGIAAFLFVGIFDVSGVLFGLGRLARVTTDAGEVPGGSWAFLGASLGTTLSALLGSSPIIIHVESGAGIRDGGRSGLTAVTISVCFLLSLFFAPLFGAVPAVATAPVLILIGAMMTNEVTNIDWREMDHAIPAFLTMVMMPFTFSIPNGLVFGLVSYVALAVGTGKAFARRAGSADERQGLLGDDDAGREVHRTPSLILGKAELDEMDMGVGAGAGGATTSV